MSLLSVCQDTARIVGFEPPNSIVGNSDTTARRLFGLVNIAGKSIAKVSGVSWPILEVEYTFSTVDGQAEYSLPSDFDYVISDTIWNRDEFDIIRGPMTPQQWQQYKSGIIGSSVFRQRYRFKRAASSLINVFVIDPTPSSAQDMVFEYVSKNWVRDSGSTNSYDSYQNDTDVALLDEYLITLSLVWRFKKEKGLDYIVDLKEYETELMKAQSRNGKAPTLWLGRGNSSYLLSNRNFPDTGYGS